MPGAVADLAGRVSDNEGDERVASCHRPRHPQSPLENGTFVETMCPSLQFDALCTTFQPFGWNIKQINTVVSLAQDRHLQMAALRNECGRRMALKSITDLSEAIPDPLQSNPALQLGALLRKNC
nr:hypothetical protein [Rhodococcus qingshengii]